VSISFTIPQTPYLSEYVAAAHYPVSREWKGYWQRRSA
jgi:hypothetical protein